MLLNYFDIFNHGHITIVKQIEKGTLMHFFRHFYLIYQDFYIFAMFF